MRHYEIVLLVHPGQSEQAPGMLERYQDMVAAADGRVHRVEDWGRRRLAYMIDDVHKAHYLLLNIECNLPALRELERHFKFNDSIIRSLVIRRDTALTEPSALALAKAEEDRIEAEKAAAQAAQEKAAAEAAAKAAAEAAAAAAAEAAQAAAEAEAAGGDSAEAGGDAGDATVTDTTGDAADTGTEADTGDTVTDGDAESTVVDAAVETTVDASFETDDAVATDSADDTVTDADQPSAKSKPQPETD